MEINIIVIFFIADESAEDEDEDAAEVPANQEASETAGRPGVRFVTQNQELSALHRAVAENAVKLTSIERQLGDIVNAGCTPVRQTASRDGQGGNSLNQSDSDVLFRSARKLSSLQTASDGHLHSFPEKGILYCDICAPNPQVRGDRTAGVFRYDMSMNTEFAVGQPLSTSFKTLRTSVRTHFSSKAHADMADKVRENASEEGQRAAGDDTAAERVLRAAYHTVVESGSHRSFERQVVLLHKSGADIGDKNHSSGMMVKARDAFHEVMLDEVKTFVEKQPCVSVVADKVTLNKRTVDITAINLVAPSAPPGDMLVNLVVAAPVVKDHCGTGH